MITFKKVPDIQELVEWGKGKAQESKWIIQGNFLLIKWLNKVRKTKK